jgi:hypothetical protein
VKKNDAGNGAMFRLSEATDALRVDGGINDGHEESREWQKKDRGSYSSGHATDETGKNRQAENGYDGGPIEAA